MMAPMPKAIRWIGPSARLRSCCSATGSSGIPAMTNAPFEMFLGPRSGPSWGHFGMRRQNRQTRMRQLGLCPHGDFVAVRVAEVKAPTAFEGFARDDFGAGGFDLGLHPVKVGGIKNKQRSTGGYDLALGIETALASGAVEGRVIRPVIDEAPAEHRSIEFLGGWNVCPRQLDVIEISISRHSMFPLCSIKPAMWAAVKRRPAVLFRS